MTREERTGPGLRKQKSDRFAGSRVGRERGEGPAREATQEVTTRGR